VASAGTTLAGRHAQHVAGAQPRDGDGLGAAVVSFAQRERGLRAREGVDACRGDLARAGLHLSRHQQEEHEHDCGVEPDVRAAAQGFDEAREVGQQHRAADQRVHAEATLAELADHAGEEGPAGVEHHRRATRRR
jgi:hypothetical protein